MLLKRNCTLSSHRCFTVLEGVTLVDTNCFYDIAGTIRHHLQADTAEFLTLFFHGRKNDGFTVGATTAFARLLATYEKLINFNIARKWFTALADGTPSQFVQPCPGGLVAAKV